MRISVKHLRFLLRTVYDKTFEGNFHGFSPTADVLLWMLYILPILHCKIGGQEQTTKVFPT